MQTIIPESEDLARKLVLLVPEWDGTLEGRVMSLKKLFYLFIILFFVVSGVWADDQTPLPTQVPGVTVVGTSGMESVPNYGYTDAEVKDIFPGPAGINVRNIVETLPGVVLGNDAYYGVNTLHIRGGTGYDVGYAFDGVPTYDNITFSENNFNSIGTNFTNVGTARTDVYVGGYPAQYGNFISGFIDQTAKRGEGDAHATLQYSTGFWADPGSRLPSYNPTNGSLIGYNGQQAYMPTDVNFEFGGKDKRFSYYFNQEIQDKGMVDYATGIDVKPLVNELGGGLPYSTKSRDTVANFTYDLTNADTMQFLFYEGISTQNYAGFQPLPCAPTTSGCVGTSNPHGAGFGETYNANMIAPLGGTQDNYFFDLEKLEWSHHYNTDDQLTLRTWRYNPGFVLSRFDVPFDSLWEFQREANQGLWVEDKTKLGDQHVLDAGVDFIYSKNYFLSSPNDLFAENGPPGVYYNPTTQIVYGPGLNQATPETANIIGVPDTQTWSGWLTDQWRPTPKLLLELGLRWDRQNTLMLSGPGIATAANGQPFVTPSLCPSQGLCGSNPGLFNPSQISPRLGATYDLSDKMSLSGSYGEFVTFSPSRRIDALRYSSTSTFSSTYIPSLPNGTAATFQLLGSQTQYGQNLDLSWEYKLGDDSLLKLTPYIKHMKNPLQIAIIDDFPTTTNAGTIESKGMELFLKTKEWRGITGWLSYTYSNTVGSSLPYQTDLMDSLIDPRGFSAAQVSADAAQIVPTAYDQRHSLNINTSIKRGKWEISPGIQFGSGYPYGLGLDNLSALAALMDPASYIYGGTHTVAQSVTATPNFNPLGETSFNSLRTPSWWMGNLAVAYHFSDDASMVLNIFNLFNSNQVYNYDNTVFSGVGYAELTNPNIGCCYTSNDTTANILPQYNPLHGQYAPIAYPTLRQFYLTFIYKL